jgi:hypothetical protein
MIIVQVEVLSGLYRVTCQDGTICFVPKDEGNADYHHVQLWLSAHEQAGD